MAACEVCGGPLGPTAKVGVCRRNPECDRENNRRHLRTRGKRVYCPSCGQATYNPDSHVCRGTIDAHRAYERAAVQRRRQAWTANLVAYLDANPLADWFEAAPQDKPAYLARFIDANPKAVVRWRINGHNAPTLARLTLPGRAPLYGISGGLVPRAAPYPADSGIVRVSWNSHAEGHCFAQALAAGHTGGHGVLCLDHSSCAQCFNSMPGFARVLNLSGLTVNVFRPDGNLRVTSHFFVS